MNQRELSELRRRWRPEKNAVSRIYGCFVNSGGELVSDLEEPLGMLPQEEVEQYLGLLKKTMSGTLGKNLIDIVFSTQQVMDGEEHRLLMNLRDSELQDGEIRRNFYQKVIGSLDMDGRPYVLLLAHDTYDVPHKGGDGEFQQDASDEVFSYIVCAVCPVKLGKVELNYFPGDNEFHCTARQTVMAPELGFVFPAFDDRSANIYDALFYSQKSGDLHQEFIDAVFHIDPPMSAAEQKEAFQTALSEALEDTYSFGVAQAIHEHLSGKLEQHKECKIPEPLTISVGEMKNTLRECGVPEERITAFEQRCSEQFGSGTVLYPENILDAGRFEIKTAQAAVRINPEYSHLAQARMIDGKKYILIPIEEGIEVNGLAVTAPDQ